MPFRIEKVLGLLSILLVVPLMIPIDARAANTDSAEQPAIQGKTEEPPPGLAELVSRSSKLHERLSQLEKKIIAVFDLPSAKKWYDEITVKLEKLTEREKFYLKANHSVKAENLKLSELVKLF